MTVLEHRKRCGACRCAKPLTLYRAKRTGKDGLTSLCDGCLRRAKRHGDAKRANRSQEVSEYSRAWKLKNLYGISETQYLALLASQGGKCAICESTDPKGRKRVTSFAIDHDHETGVVRGLLCRPCNTALGLLRDSQELMRRAIGYLQAATAKEAA